jgi:hypothetical protein
MSPPVTTAAGRCGKRLNINRDNIALSAVVAGFKTSARLGSETERHLIGNGRAMRDGPCGQARLRQGYGGNFLSASERELEVRGVEPLCPGPSRTASTCIASLWISPRAARGRALRLRPAVVEDTAAGSRRPPPLFLLSTFPAPSRSQGGNVTALRRPLAFLRCCHLFFRRGINERPPTLDRQLRAPTKGRIRNTPEREK